jgi:thiol-disulfide isomerase/thioredoxin
MDVYRVSDTPTAVIVHPSGVVGSPLATGPDRIRALLDEFVELLAEQAGFELEDEGEVARAWRESASPLTIGSPAPKLKFRGLDGKTVRPAHFRGRDVVLLFWGPRCSFCREMLPDLEAWESHRPEGAPDLLLVLPSPPGSHQRVSSGSTVVIDQDGAAARALHAELTPSAVLIDAAGNIASQPTLGAVPVLQLLGVRPEQFESATV